MVAQCIHAAGESAPGNLDPGTYAVALAARDEAHLLEVAARLGERGVPHHLIREPDPPFLGSATAIGIPPAAWRDARRALSTLPLLRGPP